MRSLTRVLLAVAIVSFLFAPSEAVALGNASLYISPSTGSYARGATFSVAVRINTGGDAINAAEGSIVFDASKLEVRSISKSGSIFTLWPAEPSFSNAEGVVEFGGGLPSPGYSGSNGLVLTIVFVTKASTASSPTQVVLVSGAVLANDGLGTNILTSLGKGSYTIGGGPSEPREPAPEAEPATPSGQLPLVTSKTHPDSAAWYAEKNPQFSWVLPPDVQGVSYLITDRPTSNPGNTSDGLKDSVSFAGIADGTHYFHIKFRRGGIWGPIRHIQFNTDTVAPQAFTVTTPDDVAITSRPQIIFSTTDSLSGVDRYTVQIDDGKAVTVEPAAAERPYALPGLFSGTHLVTVTAFDAAGNGTSAKISIEVRKVIRPRIYDIPRRIASGAPIIIKGDATPDSEVEIYFENTDATPAQIIHDPRIVKTIATTSDATGTWKVEVRDVPDGVYRVVAYIQYPDGSISLSSDPATIHVGGVMFGSLFGWLVDLFRFLARLQERWLILSIILYTLLGLLLAHYLPKISKAGTAFWRFQKKVRVARNLQKDEHQLVKRLVGLHEEITKELKLLQGIGKHRALYPDERYLRTKLVEYQKALKPTAPRKRKRSRS